MPGPASAEPPRFDEDFVAVASARESEPATGTFSNVQGECVENGISTYSFTVTGLATGAYPGTFTEEVTYSFDSSLPIDNSDPNSSISYGVLVSYDATFTVTSGATTVTGEKHLVPELATTTAYCAEGPSLAGRTQQVSASGALRYQAVINGPEGRYRATGTSGVSYGIQHPPIQEPGSRIAFGYFFENFSSAGNPLEPLLPSSKEECKSGGYEKYGIFKNQGDCVAFVQTQGRNEPGQNLPG